MPSYLLIESRDPFENDDVRYFFDLAASLARAENRVTLFLVQNGVCAARTGEHTFWFAALAKAGVEILADDVSLRERGIGGLSAAVRPAEITAVLGQRGEGRETLWD
jgi:sulfur relay (sulfurtransferase) complex TusBCD TusD component (DsrE family)